MMIAASASFAQLGARIGLDLAKWGADAKDDYKASAGLHLGVVDNIELGGDISLQPGVYYMQRNTKLEAADLKTHTHYLDIPVLVKYNLDLGSDLVLDPHVGPYFGFGFAGKVKDTDIHVFRKDKPEKEKPGMDFSNFDMGLNLGCGITYSSVYFGLDYQWGFKDISKAAGVEVRNNNFMVTFGVWFE